MWPYWLMFLSAAVPALTIDSSGFKRIHLRNSVLTAGWTVVVLVLVFLIGFRFEVGGDWGNYLNHLYVSGSAQLSDLEIGNDPGYWLLNMMSNQLGWGIVGVNCMAAVPFAVGLALFCQSLPRPWIALLVSVPYMVIVVAMGYTRQGTALGLVMIGLVSLTKQRHLTFAFWIAVAAMFHSSAMACLPIAGIAMVRNRFAALPLIGAACLMAYLTVFQETADRLLENYTDEYMQSEGAFVRLAMNAVPALAFLRYQKSFQITVPERRLWYWVSLLSVSMLVMFFLTPLSTALDRMALYFIPIQLFVFSHLPSATGAKGRQNEVVAYASVLYYGVVLFVWLSFGVYSVYWIPFSLAL